jgi:ribosome-associated protein
VNTIQGDSPIPSASRPDAAALCRLIEASLDDDKAEEIVSIDLSGKCSFADYMIVATGRSQRHVASIAFKLQDRLKAAGHPPLSIEGLEAGEWVLIDAGDVVVHLFRPEVREYYNLEKMWAIPMPAVSDPARHEHA